MPKLFHLSCSPRADSESSAGARVFVDRFRQARPDWDIDVMNLWRDHLPEFEGYVLEAKYARIGGHAFTDSQRDAFAVTERIALRFALADRVLISTPMWNFGIPYKLKRGRIDMATPYLREALRFIGVRDARFVPIGPTTGPDEPIRNARESAHRRLAEMAARF